MTKARFLRIHFIFNGAAIAVLLASMIDVALPLTPVFAQTVSDESAEPPAAWSPEQKQFWVSRRKSCFALFKDMEARRNMTADQLAKLPNMSPSESRARVDQEHGCMSIFPPRRTTNLISPPAKEDSGAPQATVLPTPLPSTLRQRQEPRDLRIRPMRAAGERSGQALPE